MSLCEIQEELELKNLSPYAAKSIHSKGRKKPKDKCDMRTEYQRDRDRIIHSKALRRLMHKTQVFISPEGDHYRTRLTHTLEVAQISRTIARALRLNEDLTEAVALGHDLGHTPFGHTGEEAFDRIWYEGFQHNEHSVRICEVLEGNCEGLNLTAEVLDGILNHRGAGSPSTLEGKIVQISDKIGYINHDIDDAIRAGLLSEGDLPKESLEILGNFNKDRIDFLIRDVISNSMDKNDISMTPHVKNAMYDLRQYMYDTVYMSQLQMIERRKIARILEELYNYYRADESRLPKEYRKLISKGESIERAALDTVAGMTDRYAMNQYNKLFLPDSWAVY
ncbi:MAG: deoxyguanosinetriphosphate triphosphohydrolase [Defluviitaleaceae bacterium]|nr:deoxyguanosinetriphosphate triphosphohydrolase [Defluviitaleaceae bacterium]